MVKSLKELQKQNAKLKKENVQRLELEDARLQRSKLKVENRRLKYAKAYSFGKKVDRVAAGTGKFIGQEVSGFIKRRKAQRPIGKPIKAKRLELRDIL